MSECTTWTGQSTLCNSGCFVGSPTGARKVSCKTNEREPSAGCPIGSHEPAGLADHLLARVAVEPLGRRVPAGDDAVGPDADVGFPAELDDRRQSAHPVALVVCLLAVGQVVH